MRNDDHSAVCYDKQNIFCYEMFNQNCKQSFIHHPNTSRIEAVKAFDAVLLSLSMLTLLDIIEQACYFRKNHFLKRDIALIDFI